MKRITRETLFKPTRAESKQAATDVTARAMLEAETDARRKKTERLRLLRLEAESADEIRPAEKRRSARPVGGTGRRAAKT
jgi:hypothetical protein